jgi:hypothetical protein
VINFISNKQNKTKRQRSTNTQRQHPKSRTQWQQTKQKTHCYQTSIDKSIFQLLWQILTFSSFFLKLPLAEILVLTSQKMLPRIRSSVFGLPLF